MKNLKLGQSKIFAKNVTVPDFNFVDLIKQYNHLTKKSLDATLEFDALRKTKPKENAQEMEEGGTKLDSLLSQQQAYKEQAKKALDQAYKAYKKDKVMKSMIKFTSKKDLEEAVKQASFIKMIEQKAV